MEQLNVFCRRLRFALERIVHDSGHSVIEHLLGDRKIAGSVMACTADPRLPSAQVDFSLQIPYRTVNTNQQTKGYACKPLECGHCVFQLIYLDTTQSYGSAKEDFGVTFREHIKLSMSRGKALIVSARFRQRHSKSNGPAVVQMTIPS